ncbi:MAG: N-acetyltransferase [Deltaproteobacteria bacterium]|nr:N-acetyltransferase [Deltaproteobacteria bacterium]
MVRKAVLDDVPAIHEIVQKFAEKGVMLQRPIAEIYDNMRDFFVFEEGEKVVGTCALHICSGEMAEIRSLAVRQSSIGKGIGRKLVQACIDEARMLGIKQVFALTYQTGFFHKLKFRLITKEVLPHKIWGDCIKCAKFPNCDENAVIIDL